MIIIKSKQFYKIILKSLYLIKSIYIVGVEGRGYEVEAFSLTEQKPRVFPVFAYSCSRILYMKSLY